MLSMRFIHGNKPGQEFMDHLNHSNDFFPIDTFVKNLTYMVNEGSVRFIGMTSNKVRIIAEFSIDIGHWGMKFKISTLRIQSFHGLRRQTSTRTGIPTISVIGFSLSTYE
jgi:hypothetical protein